MAAGNNQYLKEMNQALVLELVRTGKGASRKALADATGLSPTACGAIVKSLIADEYLVETGEGESSGGRRPVILKMKPRSYYAIGFDIDRHFLHTVVMDFTGEVLYSHRSSQERAVTPDEAIAEITKSFQETCKRFKLRKERILGVGVSVPGMVDRTTKDVLLAPNIGWKQVSLKKKLEEQLDLCVDVENESVCSASSEHWIGSCRDTGDFICINVDSGIGAALYIDGKLHRGVSGSAGEIGHIVVDRNGPACTCGNHGCLETYSSQDSMLREYGTFQAQMGNNQIPNFDQMLQAAEAGDPTALVVLDRAAVSLGRAIGMMINILNPSRIVLGKCFPQMSHLVLEKVREEAAQAALTAPAQYAVITPSTFGVESSALGAAIYPIRRIFGH